MLLHPSYITWRRRRFDCISSPSVLDLLSIFIPRGSTPHSREALPFTWRCQQQGTEPLQRYEDLPRQTSGCRAHRINLYAYTTCQNQPETSEMSLLSDHLLVAGQGAASRSPTAQSAWEFACASKHLAPHPSFRQGVKGWQIANGVLGYTLACGSQSTRQVRDQVGKR